jgi:hypothetical protein
MSKKKPWLTEGKTYAMPFGVLKVHSVDRAANGNNILVLHFKTDEGHVLKRVRVLSDEEMKSLVAKGPTWDL